MERFVSRRSPHGALIVLVSLVALEHTSFAKTPALDLAVPIATTTPVVSEELSRPTPALGSPVFAGRFSLDAARPLAARVFVECHISRHPLSGLRAADLACPLLFAEARSPASLSGAEPATPDFAPAD